MAKKREQTARGPYWPLMLREELAAAYLDLPVEAFLKAVEHRRLPKPRDLMGHLRWHRPELDRAFEEATGPLDSEHDEIMAAIERMAA